MMLKLARALFETNNPLAIARAGAPMLYYVMYGMLEK